MSVELHFMTIVIRKDALAQHYPGGLPAFKHAFPSRREDDDLVGMCAMSGGEIGEMIEQLAAAGFDTDRHVAVGDMWAGPFQEVSGIVFAKAIQPNGFPLWSARRAD